MLFWQSRGVVQIKSFSVSLTVDNRLAEKLDVSLKRCLSDYHSDLLISYFALRDRVKTFVQVSVCGVVTKLVMALYAEKSLPTIPPDIYYQSNRIYCVVSSVCLYTTHVGNSVLSFTTIWTELLKIKIALPSSFKTTEEDWPDKSTDLYSYTCCMCLVRFNATFTVNRGCHITPWYPHIKGEVQRKMNSMYVLGFVVLRDVVKVAPVSSFSFARKTTGRNQARRHWGHGPKDEMGSHLSLPSPTCLIWYLFI